MAEEVAPAKRPLEEEKDVPEEGAGSNENLQPETKKQRTEQASVQVSPPTSVPRDSATILKQVEYYMSDENLRHDQFFHEKISADTEGWLDMKLIMSCKKIIAMKVELDEVLEALKPSKLEIRSDETGTRIRRNRELPPLEPRKRKDAKPKQSVHHGGCVAKVTDIPEEVSWTIIKDQIVKKLPQGAGLRFVSQVEDATCFVFAKTFDDAEAFFSACTFEVNGVALRTQLAADSEARDMLTKKLPRAIKRDRDREVARGRQQLQQAKQKTVRMPVTVAGTKFDSIEHLRQCVKEVISATKPFTDIPQTSPSYKVVRELLDYHPRAAEKARDWAGLRVGLMGPGGKAVPESEAATVPKAGGKSGVTQCFFVVRTNGETEDFSVHKCIDELTRRVQDEASKETPVASTSSTAAGEEGAASPEASEAAGAAATAEEAAPSSAGSATGGD